MLTLVRTNDGALYEEIGGGFYRVYEFIEDSVCLEKVQSAADFEMSARAFGDFQSRLSGFPADTLSETIAHFHDTPDRYRIFREAIESDPLGRASGVQREIDFAQARAADAGVMTGMRARGELPLRVTHNDTKLNNVLLDAKTRTPLCVIDLDTVMPGLAGNDFGDSIRFGASTAAEDERDLSKVGFSLPLYEAYARGYLAACGKNLTEAERETLPMGAKLMTLECGVRFLTDHILGDTYSKSIGKTTTSTAAARNLSSFPIWKMPGTACVARSIIWRNGAELAWQSHAATAAHGICRGDAFARAKAASNRRFAPLL